VRAPGVKSVEGPCATKGHGSPPLGVDAEPRKRGSRPVLETPVVHALNDGRRAGVRPGPLESRASRLGNSRKAGDLMGLAGARTNGEACGLIRQYTGNLTSHCTGPAQRLCVVVGGSDAGAAWLSSVRAVRLGVGSPNERNLPGAGGPSRLQSSQRSYPLGPVRAWAPAQPSCRGSQVNMA